MCDLRFRIRLGLRFGLGCGLGISSRLRVSLRRRFSAGIALGCRFVGLGLFLRLVNRPDHIECAFRIVFEFVSQDAFTAVERIFEADEFSLDPAKLFGGEKWLREESLQPSGTRYYFAVVRR
jgi:hypothetical protein